MKYLSTIVPVVSLGCFIFVASLRGMFGVALGTLGMLGTLTMGLIIDAFSTISDNGGGIAVMSQLDEWVRGRTDVLDTAGNTNAVIGKGFAIGSAGLVSALFGTVCVRVDTTGGGLLPQMGFHRSVVWRHDAV